MSAAVGLAIRPGEPRAAERLAALPMYDLPELARANDELWAGIGERLRAGGMADAPVRLTRTLPLDTVWTASDLLLAQACGYPLMTSLRGRVKLVATPRYTAPGCDGPFRRSVVVVRTQDRAGSLGDLRGRRLALNGVDSDSGMNLLRGLIAPLARGGAFFGQVEITGSHAASVEAVAEGSADLSSIDCVTWAHLERLRPQITGKLRILAWTAKSPGLPLITAGGADAAMIAALRAALDDVLHAPELASARRDLMLDGFSVLPEAGYQSVLDLETLAIDHGYPKLI